MWCWVRIRIPTLLLRIHWLTADSFRHYRPSAIEQCTTEVLLSTSSTRYFVWMDFFLTLYLHLPLRGRLMSEMFPGLQKGDTAPRRGHWHTKLVLPSSNSLLKCTKSQKCHVQVRFDFLLLDRSPYYDWFVEVLMKGTVISRWKAIKLNQYNGFNVLQSLPTQTSDHSKESASSNMSSVKNGQTELKLRACDSCLGWTLLLHPFHFRTTDWDTEEPTLP